MATFSFIGWVVPPGRAVAWKAKRGETKSVTNGLLNECLDYFVDQYVLVMDINPTVSFYNVGWATFNGQFSYILPARLEEWCFCGN